ncbi:acyl-CoA dehydrogenase family protein [Cytobacillus horneckiae]|uniref:acyl-CoA dehydrogenase family protein n=1 Tax=Cytobacillus horneckiae TaxID=549687 RepID=UPI0034CDDFA0
MIGTITKDIHIRNDREGNLAEKANALALEFENFASTNDQDAQFPFASFARLRESGLLNLTIPKIYGGEEATLYETIIVLEALAKGDGSVALAAGWHLCLFLNERNALKWDENSFQKICRGVIENGDVINIFATEKKGGNIFRGSKPETIARRIKDGYIISGEKAFATLSPIADPFIVVAWIEDEGVLGEFLVRRNESIEIVESWNTIGMRSTGSHHLIFHEVEVPRDALLSRFVKTGGTRNRSTLLFISAVFLGVAHAARDLILDYTVNHFSSSLNIPICEIPHINQKIGEIEALLTTSRIIVYSLADKWDASESDKERDDLFRDFHAAKYIVCHQAIKIVELCMRIAGGRGLSKDFKLERLFRDVQCALSMHPADDMIIEALAKTAVNAKH